MIDLWMNFYGGQVNDLGIGVGNVVTVIVIDGELFHKQTRKLNFFFILIFPNLIVLQNHVAFKNMISTSIIVMLFDLNLFLDM